MGCAVTEGAALRLGRAELLSALDDQSAYVRIVAAEALGRFGSDQDVQRSLSVLGELGDWGRNNVFVVMAALNAIDALGDEAAPSKATLRLLSKTGTSPHARYAEYVPRLLQSAR
ncbi:MAG: hypothetical protein HY288_19270 [Planctomycetia bacterium]|nr:hypothetical protein [Planctomycetia bacterium]